MKKKISPGISLLLITACSALCLNSCDFSHTGKLRSSGTINELLIVTDSKTQWEGAFGDSLRAFFQKDLIGLPQPEPIFDIINIASRDLGDLYKKYHNIFIVEINPQTAAATMEILKDVWSAPQRVIKLSAPSETLFQAEFNARKDTILQIFTRLERERTLTLSEMSDDMNISSVIANKFGISLPIPGGFFIAKDSPDFIWLRHHETKARQEMELGIMIYSRNYKDSIVFNPNQILSWRNQITREYVPGSAPGSFMKVSQEFIPPVFQVMHDFPGDHAVETRGLWEMENDFMGGAFISYTFLNNRTSKVITLDGYVYNPNNDKKNYIRHLESIFWAAQY